MKTPIRYVFLLLFIIVFTYFFISITSRLNELFNRSSSMTTIEQQKLTDFDQFKQRKTIRLRKSFKSYKDEDHNLDELDVNHNVNRSIWKQIAYKSPFNHQGKFFYLLKHSIIVE